MIEHPFRWYHYMMPPFILQFAVTASCALLIIAQLAVYDGMEQDIVVFEGECKVTVGPTNDDGEVTRRGAVMQCGDDTRLLGVLESPYLYEVLTQGREPVIFCVKTESEYLKEIDWQCEMDPELKENT